MYNNKDKGEVTLVPKHCTLSFSVGF